MKQTVIEKSWYWYIETISDIANFYSNRANLTVAILEAIENNLIGEKRYDTLLKESPENITAYLENLSLSLGKCFGINLTNKTKRELEIPEISWVFIESYLQQGNRLSEISKGVMLNMIQIFINSDTTIENILVNVSDGITIISVKPNTTVSQDSPIYCNMEGLGYENMGEASINIHFSLSKNTFRFTLIEPMDDSIFIRMQ